MQVIAQKGMELGRPFRVALLILEDLGGDDPDAVDLRREGRVFDGVVHRPDLGQHRVLLVHRGSLLLLRLFLLRRGRVVQPLTGEDQPVPAVVQETQGEQPVIQHILQQSRTLAGEAPVADASVEMEMVWRRPIMAR